MTAKLLIQMLKQATPEERQELAELIRGLFPNLITFSFAEGDQASHEAAIRAAAEQRDTVMWPREPSNLQLSLKGFRVGDSVVYEGREGVVYGIDLPNAIVEVLIENKRYYVGVYGAVATGELRHAHPRDERHA